MTILNLFGSFGRAVQQRWRFSHASDALQSIFDSAVYGDPERDPHAVRSFGADGTLVVSSGTFNYKKTYAPDGELLSRETLAELKPVLS